MGLPHYIGSGCLGKELQWVLYDSSWIDSPNMGIQLMTWHMADQIIICEYILGYLIMGYSQQYDIILIYIYHQYNLAWERGITIDILGHGNCQGDSDDQQKT